MPKQILVIEGTRGNARLLALGLIEQQYNTLVTCYKDAKGAREIRKLSSIIKNPAMAISMDMAQEHSCRRLAQRMNKKMDGIIFAPLWNTQQEIVDVDKAQDAYHKTIRTLLCVHKYIPLTKQGKIIFVCDRPANGFHDIMLYKGLEIFTKTQEHTHLISPSEKMLSEVLSLL